MLMILMTIHPCQHFVMPEENFSCETSPHIDEDIHFNDLEFDCISVDSTDYEDNDTNQNDDVKVNLANLNEPLYPSSSVSLLEAYISILAFSLRHNITKTCMQDLLQLFNVLLSPSNLPAAMKPARAAIQNFILYNGKYGCGFCQHSGERVEKGKGFCRIYPLQQPLPEIRSVEQCVNFSEEDSLTGKAVHGVKGPTELMKLYPNFDLVQSFVPDYMHAVLLGVVRQIVSLWIQTSSNDFSINQKSLRVLNHRILNIKFPQETTRKLRSTNEVLFWKASEFRIFLFVSPIILKHLISKNVYNHWLLLVHRISLLLDNEVTTNDLEEAEFALQKFVYGVKDIYGIQEQTYNIHLLLHLPQAIKSWGPLWAHSCFIYEGALGQLKQFHHGTRGEASQILSSYAMQSIL
ncbi:hypothetical protein AVEN_90643-1 [Araneus ventricosus]|uniref:DUF4218 domain-containing protein n=1 Tax=Araneus ventricosus TaxID=182803 RepID=A0A4Y2P7B1_ARAVE|nr:hypothetical protein AVEN_90643-1 [Araneus ventricosus]